MTEYNSSPIDWCEENYTHSPYIAGKSICGIRKLFLICRIFSEMMNTVSNILFLTLPPVQIYLHKSYVRVFGKG